MNPSENEYKQEYEVGDICIVSQPNNYLQFHTVHIAKIFENILLVRYYISIGSQVKLLKQIRRSTKRSNNRRHIIPRTSNRQVTYRYDNKAWENNTKQDNSGVNAKG